MAPYPLSAYNQDDRITIADHRWSRKGKIVTDLILKDQQYHRETYIWQLLYNTHLQPDKIEGVVNDQKYCPYQKRNGVDATSGGIDGYY